MYLYCFELKDPPEKKKMKTESVEVDQNTYDIEETKTNSNEENICEFVRNHDVTACCSRHCGVACTCTFLLMQCTTGCSRPTKRRISCPCTADSDLTTSRLPLECRNASRCTACEPSGTVESILCRLCDGIIQSRTAKVREKV